MRRSFNAGHRLYVTVRTFSFGLRKNFEAMEGIALGDAKNVDVPISAEASPKKTNFVGITPQKQLTNVTTPTDRPFRVSVEGNIGAGKSSFIQYFSTFQNIETYPEPIDWWRNLDGHNLLDLLYKDINKWHTTFQTYVQLTRLKVQTSKPTQPTTTVQMFERSLQNNRYCFVEQAYNNGYLHDADYAILDKWYRWIRETVDINLDLIVYLRSSPEVVYERIMRRARPEEKSMSLDYLKQLHESHERWLMTDDERFNTIPVLVLDANTALEDIVEQYKLNENRIMGNKSGKRKVSQEDKERVRKVLHLDK